MERDRMVDLRAWALVGVLIGIFLAFGLAGGGCSTIKGVARDLGGAFDGMMHVSDTNGQRVPSGR